MGGLVQQELFSNTAGDEDLALEPSMVNEYPQSDDFGAPGSDVNGELFIKPFTIDDMPSYEFSLGSHASLPDFMPTFLGTSTLDNQTNSATSLDHSYDLTYFHDVCFEANDYALPYQQPLEAEPYLFTGTQQSEVENSYVTTESMESHECAMISQSSGESSGPPRRRPFLNLSDKREIAQTRKATSCIRCRMHRIRVCDLKPHLVA
jgi:hypothetical protein